jgi:hypothetical protein
MSKDRTVRAADVLGAEMELLRAGSALALQRLEEKEPDLAEYVLENLSLIHSQLMELGGPLKKTRRAYKQVEKLLLVSLTSQHKGLRRLWEGQEDLPETPEPPLPPTTGTSA